MKTQCNISQDREGRASRARYQQGRASLRNGWNQLAVQLDRRLAWSPDAFTFQWELRVVQVSNMFSSETVRAAKVLEESQPVTGASSSVCSLQKHIVMHYLSPRVTVTVGLMTSPRTSLTIRQNNLCCRCSSCPLTPASNGILLYIASILWDSIED